MGILKYISIKAPKTLNDLRIRHLKSLTDERFQNEMSLDTIIDFIHAITDSDKEDLRKVNKNDLLSVHRHCVRLFKYFQIGDPKQEITILKQTYVLVDPAKVGIGWHIDISNSDLQNDPSRLASLMYIEKGTVYGELDENPYLSVYKKETSKNSKFELLFDKKGNLMNLVCGKPTNACWITLK